MPAKKDKETVVTEVVAAEEVKPKKRAPRKSAAVKAEEGAAEAKPKAKKTTTTRKPSTKKKVAKTEEATEEKAAPAVKEPKVLDEAEFLATATVLRQKIVESKELNGGGKRNTLTVLDGIMRSVKVHGARQHGITKKMMKIAFVVFERMIKSEEYSEEEKAVLDSLLVITLEGIRQN